MSKQKSEEENYATFRHVLGETHSEGMLGEMTRTNRGFRLYKFSDRDGYKCSLQKSSIATEHCVWLGIDDAEPKVLHSDAKKVGVDTDKDCGWVDYPIPEEVLLNTRLHLTQQQARAVAKQLFYFAETGELPRTEIL